MTEILGLRRRLGLVLVGALISIPVCGSAQVIEIDQDGGTKTYNGPAAIHADGSIVPLGPTHRKRVAATRDAGDGLAPRLRAAEAAALSPDLVEAVAWQESRFHPRVVSPAGAIGEMQLMPATARSLGVDPFDTTQNYRGGAAYLRSLITRYDGNLIYALAAYNAGPGAVQKYGGLPPFKETRDYVAAILERLSARATVPSDSRLRR